MSDIQDINITMKTSKGDIKLRMFAGDTQVTCASFLNLASRGFYDGIVFHRVIPNFMIQTCNQDHPYHCRSDHHPES